jgi:hypothetical protein
MCMLELMLISSTVVNLSSLFAIITVAEDGGGLSRI